MNPTAGAWQPVISWLVSLLIPVALVLAGVRLLLTPLFLEVEYRTPNFPIDRYGFTLADRLFWSRLALDYLLNDEPIDFLSRLRFEDGSTAYNLRELRHMVDVKIVVQAVLRVWYGSLVALAGLGVWAWLGGWWQHYRQGLARGGWLTALLVGAILLSVLLAFGVFFVAFHNVFFQPGTWQFLYSDTLIRLFPERFWRDAFLAVGGVAAAAGFSLRVIFRRPGSPSM